MPNEKENKAIANIFRIETKQHEKIVLFAEKHLTVQYKKSLDNIRLQITKMYESGVEATFEEMAKFNRLTNLEKQIADELKVIGVENIKTTKTALIDSFQNSYYYGGYAPEKTLNLRLGFGQLDKKAIEASMLNPLDRITWPTRSQQSINKLNQHIREKITQGLIQGDSLQKITLSIKQEMEKSAYEKFRIVRTEAGRAQSMGRLDAYNKASGAAERLGVESNKMWVATLDKRTRSKHASLDGQLADSEGFFHQGGVTAIAPRMSGVANFDIGCRCDVIMQFVDIPFKMRRENIEEKDIMDFTTFESWAKEKNINENIFREKYNFK